MVVGKPDFDLNSFGIQYKEKKVNYTNKKAGLNISNDNQTTEQDTAEKKVMNRIKPTGTPPNENAKPKADKLGRKIPETITQEGTSTTPSSSITPKDGVFDNVPYKKEDMITQEGGSSHKKKEPKMPNLKQRGRAGMDAKIRLSESKENPVLPKNAANDIIMDMNIMKLDLTSLK